MLAYIASRRMAAGVQQAAEQATGEAADEAADQHRTPLREMIEIGIDDAEVDAITEHGDRRQRGNDDEQQQCTAGFFFKTRCKILDRAHATCDRLIERGRTSADG